MIAGGVQAPLRAATRRLGRKALDPLVESVREASYPPPYPEAWYVVGRSIDFVNRPQFVQCPGNQWVVFRDARHPSHRTDWNAWQSTMPGMTIKNSGARADVRLEGPIHQLRRRYSQFYPAASCLSATPVRCS